MVLQNLIEVQKPGQPAPRSDSKNKSFREVLANKKSFEGEDPEIFSNEKSLPDQIH